QRKSVEIMSVVICRRQRSGLAKIGESFLAAVGAAIQHGAEPHQRLETALLRKRYLKVPFGALEILEPGIDASVQHERDRMEIDLGHRGTVEEARTARSFRAQRQEMLDVRKSLALAGHIYEKRCAVISGDYDRRIDRKGLRVASERAFAI